MVHLLQKLLLQFYKRIAIAKNATGKKLIKHTKDREN